MGAQPLGVLLHLGANILDGDIDFILGRYPVFGGEEAGFQHAGVFSFIKLDVFQINVPRDRDLVYLVVG